MADLREECLAGADHPLRKDQLGMGVSLDQLLQSFPARAKRQGQERLVPFIKQIEDDVGDRKDPCEELNLERGSGLVARKEQPKVRLALAEDHDLAVQNGPGRNVV